MGPDLTLLAALGLDALVGEPPARLHPVVWIGRSITWLVRGIPFGSPRREFGYGLLLAGGLPAAWAAAAWALVRAVDARSRPLGFALRAWLLKTTFAVRDLDGAGRRVAAPLAAGDLGAARAAVAMLVSRPVAGLDAWHVASAAVESVAEGTTDAFAGPWLSYAVAGLPGAVAYRVVNTLDSMIGYHGRYERAGRASARLDDLLNLLPARVSGLCVVLGAGGADARRAWRAMRRDRRLTESPNAGWPMAAMAGALGVVLEKPGHYRLNAGAREPGPADIGRACGVMRRAACCAAGAALLARGARRAREGRDR